MSKKVKNTYAKVISEFEKHNLKLRWTEEEFNEKYIGRHQKLPIICTCGNKAEKMFNDIQRGGKCKKCKTERAKKTNLEKYGVENPAQVEEI